MQLTVPDESARQDTSPATADIVVDEEPPQLADGKRHLCPLRL